MPKLTKSKNPPKITKRSLSCAQEQEEEMNPEKEIEIYLIPDGEIDDIADDALLKMLLEDLRELVDNPPDPKADDEDEDK